MLKLDVQTKCADFKTSENVVEIPEYVYKLIRMVPFKCQML